MPPPFALPFLILYTAAATAASQSSNLSRRILHQPFFPLDSTTSTPPSPPSTPQQHSFFPSYPSSPTPTPDTTRPGPPFSTSFPANISSLILPHSPTSTPVSKKLVAVTVALSLSAALIAAVALFLYFRSRHYRRNIASRFHHKSSASASANASQQPAVQQQLPKLRNPTTNSAEFLYLGTLANSSSNSNSNPGAGAGVGGARVSSGQSKIGSSPELHPLPPLIGRQQQQQPLNQSSGVEEDQDEFYSPRASVSGSQSTRVFSTENLVKNGGNLRNSTTSSSSSSASNSPARSASISISPPISASPKNRMTWSNPNPKSPELTKLQAQSQPPASPPLPEMTFSPPYSPSSATTSSPIKDEEEEAEESPLLSNSSSSITTSSPPQSPILSPLIGKIGKNSPDISNDSSPRRKSFSSLRMPVFGKRKSSSQTTSVTNSPVSSVGSSSRHSRSYPASPLSNRLDRNSAFSAPPPPPPPPALGRSQSPPPPPNTSEAGGVETMDLRSTVVENSTPEVEDVIPKPKLKPLHWDKVRASSDRETVWDQFRSSSFKLNEEMIETLFVVNTPNPSQKEVSRNPIQPWPKQENRVLDPKKAQNIAILLRALNVTMEEVCEALMEGNAETLGTELLESLLKMAPTKEEERKLMAYKDDSPVKLGHAEKFLKAVIDIPFAFKRIEAMLYVANFESEVDYLKKSFETLEVACDELRNSKMFMKLLDAILKTGNRMNVGTNRGDAQAFKLDTLLKLVDIKGADAKTTLLHFVVQEIVRTEGQRLAPSNDEPKCRKLGLQIVSSLSSELSNVKKSAAMDSDVLSNDVAKLTLGLGNIGEVVRQVELTQLQETDRRFSVFMNKFVKTAEEDIFRVQAQERVALSLVKEITEYFHGNSAKEEAHPFRIFMVVRDFLTVLDRVCKEVGMINERTTVSSAHRFPIPVNPMLPVPVNPFHPQVLPGFPGQIRSSFSENGSP